MPDYELVRSRRRTVAVEITRDLKVRVRAPLRMPARDIDRFVQEHADWIESHMEKMRARMEAAPAALPPAEVERLRAAAKETLPARTERFADRMGLHPEGVKITSARTRYGSCSGKNVICFSCYLLLSPADAIDYVIVHELAHIRHKNHGREFWALVESVLPDYRARKARLIPAP